jgi:hypothetical protein
MPYEQSRNPHAHDSCIKLFLCHRNTDVEPSAMHVQDILSEPTNQLLVHRVHAIQHADAHTHLSATSYVRHGFSAKSNNQQFCHELIVSLAQPARFADGLGLQDALFAR